VRIFKNFTEAEGEIKRDLKEMGVRIEANRMQDKSGDFTTLELVNYGFTVLEPDIEHLRPTMPWAEVEWVERRRGINGNPVNPGKSWLQRRNLWEEFLEIDRLPLPPKTGVPNSFDIPGCSLQLAYTYPERFAMNSQVRKVISELRKNPFSRQLFVSMWDPHTDIDRIGHRRVPCSLGWHFILRNGKLHITYTMRSCDFINHWANDCWLTIVLLKYVAKEANYEVGQFCQFINSFHVYEQDVSEVF